MALTSNIKPIYSFIDSSFSFDNTGDYHLSIEISETSITYAVLEVSAIRYLVLENFKTNDRVDLLVLLGKYIWKSVSIAYNSKYVTLIPEEHFESNDQKKILQFNFSDNIGNSIAHHHILNTTIVGVFQFPESLETQVKQQFPTATFLHTAISTLQHLLVHEIGQAKCTTHLNVGEGLMEIIILKEGELIFHNHFDYQAPEDILYYQLFVFQQLEINPHQTDLIVYGKVTENDAIHTLLVKYIKEINFGNARLNFKFSSAFNELEKHQYLSIFNQYLCV